MKIFYAESAIDYSTYTFPYGVYCVAESKYEYSEIYSMGFLPYTGRIELEQSIFYMARSLRADLRKLTSTGENRRTDRKLEELGITTEWIPMQDFDIHDPVFRDICSNYTQERFRNGQMSDERLEYVLNHDLASYIWLCKTSDGTPLGYVLLSVHDNMVHYWYAFMNLDYIQDRPVGKWMMWNVLKEAQENGYDYAYLGTVYGVNALYKVRDHNGVEFYDGRGWNPDKELLKTLCHGDDERGIVDAFKLTDAPEEFMRLD